MKKGKKIFISLCCVLLVLIIVFAVVKFIEEWNNSLTFSIEDMNIETIETLPGNYFISVDIKPNANTAIKRLDTMRESEVNYYFTQLVKMIDNPDHLDVIVTITYEDITYRSYLEWYDSDGIDYWLAETEREEKAKSDLPLKYK